MPSTPTTKSQVQAYRFVLKRMQSALVRRDSVMLHDPMRSHGRATIVGFLLGMLGVVGFVVYGLLSPSPGVPDSGIVIGKTSGQIYVVSGTPKTLTPTFNLASARLLLMSQQQGGGAQVSDPTVVPDDSLKDLPRGRRTGIVDGPQLLPTAGQRISDNWSVCDNLVINPQLPDSVKLAQAKRETTVLAGVPSLGTELAPEQAIYAVGENKKRYLIYRRPADPNDPTSNNTVRAEVNTADTAVTTAFNLSAATPRPVSIGLLNSIPPEQPLAVPNILGKGGATRFPTLTTAGLTVGSAFAATSTGAPDYYILLQNGIQKVSEGVAKMLFAAQSSSSRNEIPKVGLDKITSVPVIQPTDPAAVPVSKMPAVTPTVLDPLQYPTACLGWSVVNNQPHTAFFVGSKLPTPDGKAPLDIGEPGPKGKIEHFYMPTGRAAVVQSATGADSFNRGPLSLISDSGTVYGIPDVNTAKGLGLYDPLPRPAPDVIIGLLPTGASLNVADAQRSYDNIEVLPDNGRNVNQAAQNSQVPASSSSGSSGN
ncbi:MAG TPA: type VII secretion protein EccB [Amycolatopsis sp.]|uniref:type VII secretion protein EccB n=1 Tax=Amycolatopsis sp. TaxID=37632 RepID=UPI002B4718B8|nr:type VII secretion protein EccB [Amycolatopsis sp.]HKS49389.1 type VII secretion protein EccB [Amycolatopsis sp.]